MEWSTVEADLYCDRTQWFLTLLEFLWIHLRYATNNAWMDLWTIFGPPFWNSACRFAMCWLSLFMCHGCGKSFFCWLVKLDALVDSKCMRAFLFIIVSAHFVQLKKFEIFCDAQNPILATLRLLWLSLRWRIAPFCSKYDPQLARAG